MERILTLLSNEYTPVYDSTAKFSAGLVRILLRLDTGRTDLEVGIDAIFRAG